MRRGADGEGHRHARLEELLLGELRSLLRDDVSDPALGDVWVTAVVLSVDYRHARVDFTLTGTASATRASDPLEDVAGGLGARVAIERALERATPYLRGELALTLDMKRVPELRFVWGGSVVVAPGER